MNPYDEQRLRNEVIYLHSLWHQGPPTPHSHSQPPQNPIHLPIQHFRNTTHFSSSHPLLRPYHQNTIHQFAPVQTRSLLPIASTTFKKRKKNKKKTKIERTNQPPPSPGLEWPCPPPPAPPTTDWAPFKSNLDPPVVSVSPQEKKRFVPLIAQNKVCQAFREFLTFTDDDGDSDSDIDSDDDVNCNDSDDDDDDDRLEEFESFFVRVFMEDNELRKYYQECLENGEFCCLVCGAVEKKKCRKMFKDCIGLVQHSMSILRTANKRAHRGFGHAVCKVLGWDIDRLPMIVMKGEPLGCPVETKPDEAEEKSMDHIDGDLEGPSGEKHEEALAGLRGPMTRSKAKMAKEALEQDEDNIVDIRVCHESLISGAELVDKSANCESSSTDCYSSEEEGASVAMPQWQQKALEACQEYFANSGFCYDGENVTEDKDELIDDHDSEECEEFKFFMRLYTEDSELRRYYKNNHREGEFYCLVCGGMKLKKWKKRFKNCIELLQHCNTVEGTKRKKAHVAYSQAIRKVTDCQLSC